MNQLELGIPPATYKVVTVFCRNPDEVNGTMWIDTLQVPVEFTNVDIAEEAILVCANEWECLASDVICTGIAEGGVNLLDWCDDEYGIV
jgi:hypothetical protein